MLKYLIKYLITNIYVKTNFALQMHENNIIGFCSTRKELTKDHYKMR